MIREDAVPILKWAGGKTQLLESILAELPKKIETYYEPFFGGGAVFFALAREGRFQRARLSDANHALVELYHVVRGQNRFDLLLTLLHEHQKHARSERYYYRVRDEEPRTDVERAARLLFLNRTCYRGLHRVNRAGAFNVPFGHYKNPDVMREDAMRAAREVLLETEFRCCDFAETMPFASTGDAIYCDPPYLPKSETASFTAYTRDKFGVEDHARLVLEIGKAARAGATCVLSTTPDCFGAAALRASGYEVREVFAERAINNKKKTRPKAPELIVVARPERFAGARLRLAWPA